MKPQVIIILFISMFCMNDGTESPITEKISKNLKPGSYKVEYFRKTVNNRSKRHNIPFIWAEAQLQNSFAYLSTKIPEPIKNLFNFPKNDEEDERVRFPHNIIGGVKKEIQKIGDHLFSSKEKQNDEKSKIEEHGRLDFFGRDIIRNVKERLDKVMGNDDPSASKGLDTDKTFFSGLKDQFQNRVKAIFPGTKWCGGGDIAADEADLGRFAHTDKCCRQHDQCPDNILTGETKYGLKNTGLFTRSSCDCDRTFYNCLKNNNNIVSNEIGFTYFSVLGPQCFENKTKITPCREESKDKCDGNGQIIEKGYQWVDNPKY